MVFLLPCICMLGHHFTLFSVLLCALSHPSYILLTLCYIHHYISYLTEKLCTYTLHRVSRTTILSISILYLVESPYSPRRPSWIAQYLVGTVYSYPLSCGYLVVPLYLVPCSLSTHIILCLTVYCGMSYVSPLHLGLSYILYLLLHLSPRYCSNPISCTTVSLTTISCLQLTYVHTAIFAPHPLAGDCYCPAQTSALAREIGLRCVYKGSR